MKTGPLPEGWIAGRGLENPLGADIHLVLNDHGPVLTEFMPEMIQTYRAGCTDASLPPIFPASAKADGTPGTEHVPALAGGGLRLSNATGRCRSSAAPRRLPR